VAGPHWIEAKAAAGSSTNYTTLRLEALFAMPLVTFDELTVPPFRRYRWGVRSSGTYLPSTIGDALEDLWEARVAVDTSRWPRSCREAEPPHRGRL
jgi:hypothetical protein